jgi:ABC-type Fe3+/spermidine/putrescine transport system ATPase subunit
MTDGATPETILKLAGVTKRFGPTLTADDLYLTVNRGEFFTFLGPSGSGKSTILRMIAGLERPDSGRIEIDGRDVAEVPPWERNLGMMFQSYAVFPHMSVAENIAYGLRVRGLAEAERSRRVAEMIELVGLSGMGDKNATRLSGGEQQRVALARALAPKPKMLLLDEPLSALDERIRRAMQAELKRVHAETRTTFIYVTHDQEEALTMSDRIAVFNRGRCAQCDAPEQLYRTPRSRFVAEFFRGCNVLAAERIGVDGSHAEIEIAGFPINGVPMLGAHAWGGHVAVRAEDVLVDGAVAASGSLSGVLEDITYRGAVLDYALRLPDGQRLTATMTRRLAQELGSAMSVSIDPHRIIPLED